LVIGHGVDGTGGRGPTVGTASADEGADRRGEAADEQEDARRRPMNAGDLVEERREVRERGELATE